MEHEEWMEEITDDWWVFNKPEVSCADTVGVGSEVITEESIARKKVEQACSEGKEDSLEDSNEVITVTNAKDIVYADIETGKIIHPIHPIHWISIADEMPKEGQRIIMHDETDGWATVDEFYKRNRSYVTHWAHFNSPGEES